ncbi:hypothetical protein GCM10007207_15740 [Asaia siamensis]|uniref:Uncharacterized protein n=1 Tax=Asaia siamensis TaxID=110479 RepID=A0ABQ1LW92_9PROT|nr:hypothetical protein AA0323_0068 [Asaia siamensis NRIC 0323]GGC31080.1 hypothetical protein GCM10007207_15740 [Asaia siamensis]
MQAGRNIDKIVRMALGVSHLPVGFRCDKTGPGCFLPGTARQKQDAGAGEEQGHKALRRKAARKLRGHGGLYL